MSLPSIQGPVPLRGPLGPLVLQELEALLPGYLRRQRWFGGKARQVDQVRVLDAIRCPARESDAHLLVLQVSYADGEHRLYTLPVIAASATDPVLAEAPDAVLGRVADGSDAEGYLIYDATRNPAFAAYR
jgi:maltose alpha-D-glucosyltransferase / alpha-amylase